VAGVIKTVDMTASKGNRVGIEAYLSAPYTSRHISDQLKRYSYWPNIKGEGPHIVLNNIRRGEIHTILNLVTEPTPLTYVHV
jgi:hypothetical protein